MKKLSTKKSAFVSVDNTRTFEDKNLNELYVSEGEQAAHASKQIADICKTYGMLTINVLEEHPIGHVSLAANYTDKNAFDCITYDEVKAWTEENNGIGERAEFTLPELKKFLSEVGSQVLRPDHSIQKTPGVELTPPLQASDFDIKIIKGTDAAKEAYSGFDETTLHETLQKKDIDQIFIGGVATDYCVGKTALDGADLGYEVYMITDAVKGVAQETTDKMIELLTSKGIKFIHSEQFQKFLD